LIAASIAAMILSTVAGRAVNLAVSKRETVSCRMCASTANCCWLSPTSLRARIQHGGHYHATPGKFPCIILGFAGAGDPRRFRRGPRG
jgi:hypothetical protein